MSKTDKPDLGKWKVLEETNIHLFNYSSLFQLLIEGRIASLSSISVLLGINNNIV